MEKLEPIQIKSIITPEMIVDKLYKSTDLLTPDQVMNLLRGVDELIEVYIQPIIKETKSVELYRIYLRDETYNLGDQIPIEKLMQFIEVLDEKKISYSINKDSFKIGDILVEKGENKSFSNIIKITLDKFIQKLIDE